MVYLDTSVLGSYYCPESLSAVVSAAIAPLARPAISRLVELEFLSLVGLKVRTRDLDKPSGHKIIDLFQSHIEAGIYQPIEVSPTVIDIAARWLSTFSTPLRTLDSLHLALAHSNKLELWTTDKRLAASAVTLRVKLRLIKR